MFFTKKLQLLSSFVIQPNAPLVNRIITVIVFCHFIFVTTPNPITAINPLSTKSVTPSTEGCLFLHKHKLSFFRFKRNQIWVWNIILYSNIISSDFRDEEYFSSVLLLCKLCFNNTLTSQCVFFCL